MPWSACARDQAVTQKAALTLKDRVESTDRPDFVGAEARAEQAGGGRLIFAPDIYGHDKKHRALLGLDRPKSNPPAQGR